MKILTINDKPLSTWNATWVHTDWQGATNNVVADWLEVQRVIYHTDRQASVFNFTVLVEGDQYSTWKNCSNVIAECTYAEIAFDNDITFKGTYTDSSVEKINQGAHLLEVQLEGVFYGKPNTMTFDTAHQTTTTMYARYVNERVPLGSMESREPNYAIITVPSLNVWNSLDADREKIGAVSEGKTPKLVDNTVYYREGTTDKAPYRKIWFNNMIGYIAEVSSSGTSRYAIVAIGKMKSSVDIWLYNKDEPASEYRIGMLSANEECYLIQQKEYMQRDKPSTLYNIYIEGRNLTGWICLTKASDGVLTKELIEPSITYGGDYLEADEAFFALNPVTDIDGTLWYKGYTSSGKFGYLKADGTFVGTREVLEDTSGGYLVRANVSIKEPNNNIYVIPSGMYTTEEMFVDPTGMVYFGHVVDEDKADHRGYPQNFGENNILKVPVLMREYDKWNFVVDGNAEVPMYIEVNGTATNDEYDIIFELFDNDISISEYKYEKVKKSVTGDAVKLQIDGETGICIINNINAVEGLISFEFPTITNGTHALKVLATIDGVGCDVKLGATGRWL